MPFGEISPEQIYSGLPDPKIEDMSQEMAGEILSQKKATGSEKELATYIGEQLKKAYEQCPEDSNLQEVLNEAKGKIYHGFGVEEKKEAPE